MEFEPFYVGTCEGKLEDPRRIVFAPDPEDPLKPFEVRDPFGVRRAILPVFRQTSDGLIYGQGTAFHVDGCGGLLTAEHVIEFSRAPDMQPGFRQMEGLPEAGHPMVMLGAGLIFGVVPVPSWALVRVIEQRWLLDPAEEDPLSFYRGQATHRIAVDVASMLLPMEGPHVPTTVPLLLSKWTPAIGEPVLAMGYPNLMPNDHAIAKERMTVVDTLYGAYGMIKAIHPKGSSRLNPTPVFEVEANWPSGMSGGPVFNRAGQVVGIVSRSISPEGDLPGVGYAAAAGLIPGLGQMLTDAHPVNPGWRVGFGVLHEQTFDLAQMFSDLKSASQHRDSLGDAYTVRRGSMCIGTKDFVASFSAFGL